METEQAKSEGEESMMLAEGVRDGGGGSHYVMQLEKLLAYVQKSVAKSVSALRT